MWLRTDKMSVSIDSNALLADYKRVYIIVNSFVHLREMIFTNTLFNLKLER